jgi:hypothetical protein
MNSCIDLIELFNIKHVLLAYIGLQPNFSLKLYTYILH